MKHLRKRLGACALAICMLLTMLPVMAFAATETTTIVLTIDDTNFTVNGTTTAIDAEGSAATLNDEGYTMLPLRAVVEAMGGTLTWDDTTRGISMTLADQTVDITIASTVAYVDGVSTSLYTAPNITNSRTLVHIRTLELFDGVSCDWDATTRNVTVTYEVETGTVIPVTLTNNTDSSITGLYYSTSTGSYYSDDVLSTTLSDGSSVTFDLVMQEGVYTYTLYAERVSSSGSTTFITYSGLNLYSVNSYASVVLNSSANDMDYALDSTVEISSEAEMTFWNDSGVDIDELYFGSSSSASTLDNGDDLLDGSTLKDGKEVTFSIDLEGTAKWYFLAIDEDGEEYVGKVTFDDPDAEELYLVLTDADDSCFEEYDPDDTSSGELSVLIVNDTGSQIYAMFLVEEGEATGDWEDYLEDAEDDEDAEDLDDLIDYDEDEDGYLIPDSDGMYYAGNKKRWVVDEDSFDADTYDLIIFYGEDLDEYTYIEDLDLEDAESYVTIYLHGAKGDFDDYQEAEYASGNYTVIIDDDEDYMLVGFYNGTGDTVTEIIAPDASDDDYDFIDDDLDSKYYAFCLIEIDDFDEDLDFEFIGDSSSDDFEGDGSVDDFYDDYPTFMLIYLTEDDDEIEIDDIEGIADL